MEIIGIIAEYNPFHLGHRYHIEKIKERYPDSLLIAVITGNFSERGIPSLYNKWKKTEVALKEGVDIVVELPFPFATQSADLFAHGALALLAACRVDRIIFGSESDDVEELTALAKVQLFHPEYRALAKLYLSAGENYPTALSMALEDLTGKRITMPNDILGLSYIKEILEHNYPIAYETIKRTNSYHEDTLSPIASATSIRNALAKGEEVTAYVPSCTGPLTKETCHFLEDYYDFFQYRLLTEEHLECYQGVDEGLATRCKQAASKARNFEEFYSLVQTKRYTKSRLMRLGIHIMCAFTKEEAAKMKEPEYLRVLGFTSQGQNYLNKIKKNVALPLITQFSLPEHEMLQLEFRATKVYSMTLPKEEREKAILEEYQHPPIRIK